MTEADWENIIRKGVTLPQAKRELVLAALRVARGNRTLASRRLGISLRAIRNLIASYKRVYVFIPPACPEGLN